MRGLAALVFLATAVFAALHLRAAHAQTVYSTDLHRVRVTTIAEGLEFPWGLAFLPGGDLLVTEREGRLRRIRNGQVLKPLSGLPQVHASGQGGLLDIALHPDFDRNSLIYFTYAVKGDGGTGTELARARLQQQTLQSVEVLFRAEPKSRGGRHFGSRIRFLPDKTLIMTLGDRGDRPRAQDLGDHAGSTIRLNDDGTIPADNPFRQRSGVRPEIFTYGNRNVQGLSIQPSTGLPFSHEHGPQGGDELNVLRPGRNYGWPVITYGRNYGIGTRIGEGTTKAGMERPLHYWDPSIAPSGMDFYSGSRFSRWRDDLFVGALKYQLLVRLRLEGERIVEEERMLEGEYGRIRDVRAGPDGLIYLLTDDGDGKVLRLEPAD